MSVDFRQAAIDANNGMQTDRELEMRSAQFIEQAVEEVVTKATAAGMKPAVTLRGFSNKDNERGQLYHAFVFVHLTPHDECCIEIAHTLYSDRHRNDISVKFHEKQSREDFKRGHANRFWMMAGIKLSGKYGYDLRPHSMLNNPEVINEIILQAIRHFRSSGIKLQVPDEVKPAPNRPKLLLKRLLAGLWWK